jgi:hypothetical protein
MKTKTVQMISVQDWDKLVKETYGRPYSFQQQDDCKSPEFKEKVSNAMVEYHLKKKLKLNESIGVGTGRGVRRVWNNWKKLYEEAKMSDPNFSIPSDCGNMIGTTKFEIEWNKKKVKHREQIMNRNFFENICSRSVT